MRLSTLLLLCLFLFCCTHLTERTAWRLRVQRAALPRSRCCCWRSPRSRCSCPRRSRLSPASLLLLTVSLRLCRGLPDIVEGLLMALLCGVLAGAFTTC